MFCNPAPQLASTESIVNRGHAVPRDTGREGGPGPRFFFFFFFFSLWPFLFPSSQVTPILEKHPERGL